MNKGTKVNIIGGRKAVGASGVIVWYGPNKYGSGMRIGVKTDDGTTEWVNEEHVERVEGAADAEAGAAGPRAEGPRVAGPGPVAPSGPEPPPLEKGTRVQFEDRGQSGVGQVFWYGPNKFGAGMRVGVRDDAGEKHWLAATQVQLLEPSAGAAPARQRRDEPPPLDDDAYRGASPESGAEHAFDDAPLPEDEEGVETDIEL